MKLNDIAYFVDDKISSDEISLNEYITTDCLLQNKKGRSIATNLPPQSCSLTKFKKGDVLIGNIRPYLKKIWFADIDGGSSLDVLVLRAKDKNESAYLYSVLMQDSFYDFVMKAPKGSKMPRGDKNHILTFPCSNVNHKIEIGNFIKSLDDKIALNRRMNVKLEQMAKRLYDHWFVQFDFPNVDGKPYKASGGKMVWNETLKREIPDGWEVKKLGDVCEIVLGGTPSTANNEFWENGTINWLNSGEVGIFPIVESEKKITEIAVEKSTTEFLKAGSVTLSITRYLRPSILAIDACINQSVVGIKENDLFKNCFLYPYLQNEIDRLMSLRTGAQQPHINKEIVEDSFINIPPKEFMEKYEKKVTPIYLQIINIAKETQKLTVLRDRLLPLLMNRQVEVK